MPVAPQHVAGGRARTDPGQEFILFWGHNDVTPLVMPKGSSCLQFSVLASSANSSFSGRKMLNSYIGVSKLPST
jgi:hypothetical protein